MHYLLVVVFMVLNICEPTWLWAAGFERKARGNTKKLSPNIGLSRGSVLQVAVEVPAEKGRWEGCVCI